VPAQDRARRDQAVGLQRSRHASDQGGEYRSVCPVHARSGLGAAEDGDLMPQGEELDVLGGGRAAHQHDQSEYLLEDQVEQP
jgi:hypothetical protein